MDVAAGSERGRGRSVSFEPARREELREKFAAYVSSRDPVLREQLVAAHLGLAEYLARRFANRGRSPRRPRPGGFPRLDKGSRPLRCRTGCRVLDLCHAHDRWGAETSFPRQGLGDQGTAADRRSSTSTSGKVVSTLGQELGRSPDHRGARRRSDGLRGRGRGGPGGGPGLSPHLPGRCRWRATKARPWGRAWGSTTPRWKTQKGAPRSRHCWPSCRPRARDIAHAVLRGPHPIGDSPKARDFTNARRRLLARSVSSCASNRGVLGRRRCGCSWL